MKPFRTRFAPSPTGDLHIGGARTALYAWLMAKKNHGEFILRVEDTDTQRNKEDSIKGIREGMEWIGLHWDGDIIFQTDRLQRYQEVANQLLADGKAYYAYETPKEIQAMRIEAASSGGKPKYNGYYRDRNEGYKDLPNRVIRFKNPLEGKVIFDDVVKGQIVWDNRELDDMVIMRSNGVPTYNFAVVVDDMDMDITHVIRGDDHVNNTPKQINLYEALNAEIPVYAHLPMILSPEGKKLSKRDGAASILAYRDAGYLQEPLLNHLARLGWSHGEQEIFTLDELIEKFDLKDVSSSPSRLDFNKLGWLNQQYMKTADPNKIVPELRHQFELASIPIKNGPDLFDVLDTLADRAQTLKELVEKAKMWFLPISEYDEKAVTKFLSTETQWKTLRRLKAEFETLVDVEWNLTAIHNIIHTISEKHNIKIGQIAQPLRVALTGNVVSPGIDETVFLMGQSEAIKRINKALELFEVKLPLIKKSGLKVC